MTEVGLVKSISGKYVEVEIDPSAGCGSCPGKSACHLEGETQKRTLKIQSEQTVGVGDLVELEIGEGQAIFSAFLVFIVPLLFLGGGYFLFAGRGQATAALGGVIGFLVGLGVIWLADRRLGARKQFQPRITRVLQKCPFDPQQSSLEGYSK